MSVLTQPMDAEIPSLPRPSRRLAAFGSFLHTISFALWLGGLIGIGALVAPNAAHVIHTYPAFASNPVAQKAILTGIIGGSLRGFNYVCYASGLLMLIASVLEGPSMAGACWKLTTVRMSVTVFLLMMAFYLGHDLFPMMDAAQSAGHMARFDALHKQYEWVSQIQLVPLVLIAGLTAWRDASVTQQ